LNFITKLREGCVWRHCDTNPIVGEHQEVDSFDAEEKMDKSADLLEDMQDKLAIEKDHAVFDSEFEAAARIRELSAWLQERLEGK